MARPPKVPMIVRFGSLYLHLKALLLLLLKKDWQCKAGRGRWTPYQSEDPNHILPTYRGKEEKGKIVEDKKEERN